MLVNRHCFLPSPFLIRALAHRIHYFVVICWFKHILFHLHEKGLGRAQMHMFRQTITIIITITRNIKEAYYYYYYFPDYYYYYYYYFTITITFIITVEPKKHNTSRLQSNIQRHLFIASIVSHTTTDTLPQIISL